jgi:hypothetical protein
MKMKRQRKNLLDTLQPSTWLVLIISPYSSSSAASPKPTTAGCAKADSTLTPPPYVSSFNELALLDYWTIRENQVAVELSALMSELCERVKGLGNHRHEVAKLGGLIRRSFRRWLDRKCIIVKEKWGLGGKTVSSPEAECANGGCQNGKAP